MKIEACTVELCNGQNSLRSKVYSYVHEKKRYVMEKWLDVKDNRYA